jgi:hypothetical protein
MGYRRAELVERGLDAFDGGAIQAGYLLGVVTCQLMPKFSHLDLRWILRWPRNTGLDNPTT